jgi:hypothetical protein
MFVVESRGKTCNVPKKEFCSFWALLTDNRKENKERLIESAVELFQFVLFLALFVVVAAVSAVEPEAKKDLKGAEQFYYAAPYASLGYAAYPYAAYPAAYYYR